jgi:hypothetical protein
MTELTLAQAKEKYPEIIQALTKEIKSEFVAELQLKEKIKALAGVSALREHRK